MDEIEKRGFENEYVLEFATFTGPGVYFSFYFLLFDRPCITFSKS